MYYHSITLEEIFPNIIPNREETVKRFSGNLDLLEKFVRKFPQDENWLNFQHIAGSENWSELEMVVHTLKGYAGNIGFQKLFELTSEVVKDIRERNYTKAKEDIPLAIECGKEIENYILQFD